MLTPNLISVGPIQISLVGISFLALRRITCNLLESLENCINFCVPESTKNLRASFFEAPHIHSLFVAIFLLFILQQITQDYEILLSWCHFQRQTIHLYLETMVAILKMITKLENRVHNKWMYHSKTFQLSATITGFY